MSSRFSGVYKTKATTGRVEEETETKATNKTIKIE